MNGYEHHAVGYRQQQADWGGVAKLAAIVGVGVAGYLLYRQFVVTTGTVKHVFKREG